MNKILKIYKTSYNKNNQIKIKKINKKIQY